MNRPWMMHVAIGVVLLALAGAAGLTVYTFKEADAYRATMKRRASDLEGLASVRSDLGVYEAAHAAFESCRTPPPPLTALMGGLLPAGPTPELRDLSEPGPSGWQRRRHELSFDQVAIADAITFAQAAETPVRDAEGNQRPGWRLAKCSIRPVPGQPGIGRVVLVMEALVRE